MTNGTSPLYAQWRAEVDAVRAKVRELARKRRKAKPGKFRDALRRAEQMWRERLADLTRDSGL